MVWSYCRLWEDQRALSTNAFNLSLFMRKQYCSGPRIPDAESVNSGDGPFSSALVKASFGANAVFVFPTINPIAFAHSNASTAHGDI